MKETRRLLGTSAGRKSLDAGGIVKHGHADLDPAFSIEFANDAIFFNAGAGSVLIDESVMLLVR